MRRKENARYVAVSWMMHTSNMHKLSLLLSDEDGALFLGMFGIFLEIYCLMIIASLWKSQIVLNGISRANFSMA